MSDPISFVPLAVAGAAGTIDGAPTPQSVAAGVTLLQRSAPLVRALKGHRAAILLPTSPAFLTALAACDGRGAVLINPLAARAEVAYQIDDADVGAVFTNRALACKLPSGVPHVLLDDAPRRAHVVAGTNEREIDLGSHFPLALEGEAGTPGSDEEVAIVYTSAMTGRALGAILTHRNLLSNAHATIEAAALTSADHALALLPFSHLFGLVVSGLAPLLAGGRVTCMDRFNPIRAIDVLESEGITLLVGVPAVFGALATALSRRGTSLGGGALRVCICGGAPLSIELQDRWFELTGVELRQGYGLTEGGPVCLFNRVDRSNRRATLGIPFPGVAVEIQDLASGRSLGAECEGEICVAGENLSPGYVGGATEGLQRRGRWLRTGDLGVQRANGTFVFRGLAKPMFTHNGFNIYPRELERVIGEMPGIRRVEVAAIPDTARENEIFVTIEGDVDEAGVKAWCEERLSTYKQPGQIVIRREVRDGR